MLELLDPPPELELALPQARVVGLPQVAGGDSDLREILDAALDGIFEQARFAELVLAESNNPASPAYRIVNEAFDQCAVIVAAWLRQQGRAEPSRVFLKAVMAACQWLVHDAIRAGPSEASRREAKDATWLLASSLLAGLPVEPAP